MNEVDRIKSEDWLPESFFEPETKNDFLVTQERKELWACLLDLLRQFKKVCDNNNLTYHAIGGTLLGAIRHNGFIPWDDDLDFSMPREDYEKLKKLKDQFAYPYKLCWIEEEPENGYTFMKLRNANTTGTSKAFANLDMNHGLYLDIFPMDDIDISTYYQDQAIVKERAISITQVMKTMSANHDKDLSEQRAQLRSDFDAIELVAQKDNGKGLTYASNRTTAFYGPEKLLWKKDWFAGVLDVPFENIMIKVPCGWNEILSTHYGDWAQLPPVAERGQWHSSCVFNPKIAYCELLKK